MLLLTSVQMMQEYYNATYVSLHVRVTNKPALHMYKDILGFEVTEIEKEYYNDKEDAYTMKKFFKEKGKDAKVIELKNEINFEEIKDCFEEVDENGEEKN
jgi:peptide alpha-N-acetyltransferase